MCGRILYAQAWCHEPTIGYIEVNWCLSIGHKSLRPTRPPLHRNRHAQETCVGREGVQLSILQMGWDKKNFSWRKASPGTAEISSETTNDRELSERGCFAGFIKIPLPDFE